jgi:metal-sulfur cluster biosynthetic enzyme
MSLRAEVLGALAGVRDPELDQPLTELDFISSVDVAGEEVEVHLRLPTYFCAQNFAYLMAADAKAAIMAIPQVKTARVFLDDHCASEEINAGVGSDKGFGDAFPDDETDGDDGLDDLRDRFRRKGFLSRQETLCAELLRRGRTQEGLTEVRVGDLADLPAADDVATYLDRRRELGLDTAADAPFLIDPDGNPIPVESVPDHLLMARMVRLSIEGNAGLCRALLDARYGLGAREEAIL